MVRVQVGRRGTREVIVYLAVGGFLGKGKLLSRDTILKTVLHGLRPTEIEGGLEVLRTVTSICQNKRPKVSKKCLSKVC